jgi:hypothetical protein
MYARRLFFALSATLLLIAPCAASADQHDDGDRWGGGYADRGDRHWDRGDRDDRHWDRDNRYAWNHDEHRYWSRERHCWISDRNYYWDAADYHWIPDNRGNFILVHLNI